MQAYDKLQVFCCAECLWCMQFNCGGRSIKQGLIAVDIVSHCEPPPAYAIFPSCPCPKPRPCSSGCPSCSFLEDLVLTCQLCSKIFHALQGQYALCHWQAKSLCCAGTWAATLLQSSNVAYKNGVSGPFWCAPQTCMHSTWALQSTHVTSRLITPIPAGASLSLGTSCHCHRALLSRH